MFIIIKKVFEYIVGIICVILADIFMLIGAFGVTLADDIEIYSGKSTTKKWSRESNLLRKYLFLDYRQHIPIIHYILLWVYISVCMLDMPILFLYDVIFNTILKEVFRIAGLVINLIKLFVVTTVCFTRYKLYRHNKIRRRPKKATKSQRNSVKFAKSEEPVQKQDHKHG